MIKADLRMKILQFIIILLSLWACNGAWCGDEIYYIDRDGDGFGIGTEYTLGPDADDSDADVNTPQSVLEKYGTLEAFLTHKGYTVHRKIFISPVGKATQAEVGSVDAPFASWSEIENILQPGDVVLFRQGSYSERISKKNFGGARNAPVVIMAYPGERVTFTNCGTGSNGSAIDIKGGHHLIFDGFSFDNQVVPGDGNGIYLNGAASSGWDPVQNIIIRNVEAMNVKSGLRAMVNIHDLIVENCVIHDTGSHNIYWGTSGNNEPNSDLILRDSILYMGSKDLDGRCCLQHNGIVRGLLIENNICHSTIKGGGISIENGASDSIIRNNLIFNTSKMGIQFYSYKASWGAPMVNNTVVNNTIWIGNYNVNGKEEPKHHSGILIKDNVGHLPIEFTKIRNNIISTQYGFPIHIFNKTLAETVLISNNIFYRAANESEKIFIWPGKTVAKKISIGALNKFSEYIRGNTLSNPLFKNVGIENYATPEKFDFQLLADSPARNHAVPEQETPENDLHKKKRPVTQFDAGCYEYLNDNFPPVFVRLNERIVTVANKQVAFSLGGNDPDGKILKYSCRNLPRGAAINGAVFTWTPDLSQTGEHKFLFEVNDGTSKGRMIVPVIVLTPDKQAPKILSVKPAGKGSIFVLLDEVVKTSSAEQINNYEISDGVDVLGVHYHYDDHTLTLNTSPHFPGKQYNLKIKNIEDYSGNALSKTNVKYMFKPLRGHWKLNEGIGIKAKDSSDYSFTGTIVGGPEWVSGKSFPALLFDGKNDYVQIKCREDLNPIQAFSISMWINWNGIGGQRYQALIYKSPVLDLLLDNGTVTFISNGKYKHFTKIQPGLWQYIVFTYRENGEMRIYVNGQCAEHKYKAGQLSKRDTGDIFVGARSNGRSHFFAGLIKDVRFYHSELEQSEIQNLYNEMKSVF